MENPNILINLSSRFKDILYKISDNVVSQFILNLEENQDYVYPFSFLDTTDYEDQISFLQSNKYHQIIRSGNYVGVDGVIWSSSSRNMIKIGRLITKIAPNFRQPEIENFVNLYKAEYKNLMKNICFSIVSGEDIIKYYHGKRYQSGNGPLNKSCMRHDNCLKYLELYKKNPNKIKMLILLDSKKDLLKGRALLWKLDEPKDTWLMDRIYTTTDSDVFLFKKYAEKNGWLYKETQTFDCVNVVENGERKFIDMRVDHIDDNFKYFPYIDTLLYYNKREKYLTNSEKDYNEKPDIIKLREINGSDSGNENFVYDIFNNEIINISDSIYCLYGDGYTYKNNVYFIEEKDEYCLPSSLRYSNYSKKFLPSDISVYSFELRSFINRDDVFKVYLTKDHKHYDYFLRKNIKYHAIKFYDGLFYSIDLMIKGIDDCYYFKDEYDEEKIKNVKELEKKELEKVIKNSKILSELFKKTKKTKNEESDWNERWWNATFSTSTSSYYPLNTTDSSS